MGYKGKVTDEGRSLRIEAFESGVSTGHNPSYPELKFTKDHIHQEFAEYLEDAAYSRLEIALTPLGESLLGR